MGPGDVRNSTTVAGFEDGGGGGKPGTAAASRRRRRQPSGYCWQENGDQEPHCKEVNSASKQSKQDTVSPGASGRNSLVTP